ncbi:hypothetical protein QBC47DRAFT_378423 [Echria macrotheca]|uniref:Amidohydrolase 3 domain-containing protein n=1 Tax=Echria macrotheca TaxID=438768 RepID=A0AAJ0FDE9_9PEZI|nr:hypothetical protein QBC47DRAFT_378423 [Echria macrotheca]
MDVKGSPPAYTAVDAPPPWGRSRIRRGRALRLVVITCIAFIAFAQWRQISSPSPPSQELNAHGLSLKQLQENLATCAKLRKPAEDPIGAGRERNARYLDGHSPTLIKNATIWVGEPAEGTSAEDARKGKGYDWINADVYLEYGLIKEVGSSIAESRIAADTIVFNAQGRPLTAGIIDMHSHAGVGPLPELRGYEDSNEVSSDITPYVRSIDGFHPYDHQIEVIKSGGVTTSLILPGSANNMGGEAFVIKHATGKSDGRNETSINDMLADPERNWRFMKMACGENPKRVYGKSGEHGPTSRMGESWEFRHAFEQATQYVREQDDWCEAAAAGLQNVKRYLRQEIRWNSLGALLRDQVRLNTHCYTIPDLEAFIEHTNEFKFKLRAFHHAHQTYMVPDVLKRAYGGEPPASALFSESMWYKAEAFFASEHAGKYLWDNGLTPIYVSDNPVLNAQHVVFEAAKAYRHGLPYHVALASVTTAPAYRLGFGKRLGKVKAGFDADIVVWDSDPLSVGATPVQVWIDGTAQFEDPVELHKPDAKVMVPDEKLANIVEKPELLDEVIFTGVSHVLLPGVESNRQTHTVVFSKGKIACIGACVRERDVASRSDTTIIKLENGYLTDSLTAFGSTVGLNAIDAEKETDNGDNAKIFSRAEDGLRLDDTKLHTAYKYGVTKAISAPKFRGAGTHYGTSAGFLTGATSALEKGAVFASDVAVHYTLDQAAKTGDTTSISVAVGALRRKLLEAAALEESPADAYCEAAFLAKVVNGSLPLVITAQSADSISSAVKVKATVEAVTNSTLRLVILGGAESWLVADQLADAGVGVILSPLFSYATTWDQRRALTGAPLTNGTAIDRLLDAGVPVAVGVNQDFEVYDLGLQAGIVYKNGGGRLSEKQALGLVSGNIYKLLGVKQPGAAEGHFVIHEGNPLEIGSRVKGVAGGRREMTVF